MKKLLSLLFLSMIIFSCNKKGDEKSVGKAEVPYHQYAILNPTARINKIMWINKFEFDDSLSYKAMSLMIDSFYKSEILKDSKIYWSSSEDYAIAANTLWQNTYYSNNMNVPKAFLDEIASLNERYVLLVRYTGAIRHWTNIVVRVLQRLLNEVSFGLLGLDEVDMILDASPDVNMSVLAIDRASKRIIYKGDLDLIYKSPVDSTIFTLFSQYFFD